MCVVTKWRYTRNIHRTLTKLCYEAVKQLDVYSIGVNSVWLITEINFMASAKECWQTNRLMQIWPAFVTRNRRSTPTYPGVNWARCLMFKSGAKRTFSHSTSSILVNRFITTGLAIVNTVHINVYNMPQFVTTGLWLLVNHMTSLFCQAILKKTVTLQRKRKIKSGLHYNLSNPKNTSKKQTKTLLLQNTVKTMARQKMWHQLLKTKMLLLQNTVKTMARQKMWHQQL